MYEGQVPFDQQGNPVPYAIYAKGDDPTWEATMFLSDLEDVIARGSAPLSLTGRFAFVKRGQNYGIKLLLIGT